MIWPTDEAVTCPICSKAVPAFFINQHIDAACSDPNASTSQLSAAKGLSTPVSKKADRNARVHSPLLAPIFKKKGRQTESPASEDGDPGPSSTSSKRPAEMYGHGQSSQPRKRNKLTHLESATPLAAKLRPSSLNEFVGQRHLAGPDALLTKLLGSGSMGSVIFWGPPGCGKTTLARLVANRTNAVFKELSATVVGINEVRTVVEEARSILNLTGRKTILFLDEVHRFNKAQQDIFLPFLEHGHVQLVGATTENPSFRLTGALLSRCRVFVLERLSDSDIQTILKNALKRVSDMSHKPGPPAMCSSQATDTMEEHEVHGLDILSQEPIAQSSQSSTSTTIEQDIVTATYPHITSQIIASIASLSSGDARTAISLLEVAIEIPKDTQESAIVACLKQSVSASYDRTGESHYDMISALHKSVRGSQGSAAMYWLARMLAGGEDPLYIVRRMIVCASEDIGLADNHALPLAIATLQACQTVGMPECRINLAHLVAYLAEAPKSTRAYEAYKRAEEAAKQDMTLPVPMSMRNAPTSLMKELGYGDTYRYNPDYAHPVHNTYLPKELIGQQMLKEAGDLTGKLWEEGALRQWELEDNEGIEWEGRRQHEG